MIQRLITISACLALGTASSAVGQTRLTLSEAVARARAQNLDARSAAAAEAEAAERITQARGGYFPRVDFTESWQRGDQPVFVFGSLLSQRQFTADNFAIGPLNHPDAVDNFRSAFTVEQAIFNPATSARVRAARAGGEVAASNRALVDRNLAVEVTEAYGRVLVAMAGKQTAAAAIVTAQADRELAGNRRDAGRVTDADVQQLDVRLAHLREQQMRADADERIARATLNQILGESLDAAFDLETTPEAATSVPGSLSALQTEALVNRPDIKVAMLREQEAIAARDTARAAFLPQIAAQFGWEVNGGH